MENDTGEPSEVVYGTHEDSAMVMSEKVQSLAGSIYQEFERMIQRYDEDVVKTLMPLLVNVLECLDSAYQTNQEQDVELELLREDNEQLVTQYEREKNARKQAEQKLLETEDLAEQENKELASRLESLESIVRMLELKHKNSMDHASRLEERESELKKEYSKLHERYTELFKTHVDYMERTKLMMGNSTHSQAGSASERLDVSRSRLMPMMRSTGPVSYGFASLENSTMLDTETLCSEEDSGPDSGPPSLQNEIETKATEKVEEVDSAKTPAEATSAGAVKTLQSPTSGGAVSGKTTTKKEQRSANMLYQELSFQDDNLESEENEITGAWVHPGDYASSANDNFFGMGKEVENLIMENNELLATKNALNIVKDDLIVKVDELTGEIEILREELNAVILARNKLKAKVTELEEELKKTKAQVKQASSSTTDQEEEGDVPMAQRKRFTRVEMARVLMERNQYKERFMELQDAVRWTEMMRASRVETLDKKSKQGIWKFFSNLFSSNDRPSSESPGRLHQRYGGVSAQAPHQPGSLLPAMPEGRMLIGAGSSSSGGVGIAGALSGAGSSTALMRSGHPGNILVLSKEPELTQSERAMQRRRDQYRQVRAHVQKEDGRLQAYGWSLPSLKPSSGSGANGGIGGGAGGGGGRPTGSGVPVPVPVYCRPLAEASPHMKVWCASGVNLQGGYMKDGGCIVGAASIFYSKEPVGGAVGAQITELTGDEAAADPKDLGEILERKLLALGGPASMLDADSELSSYVWICTSTHSASTVTVIDAKNPSEVLDSFPVCQNHLLCICTVRGALEMDYAMLENSEVTKSGHSLEKPGESPDDIGKVSFEKVIRQPVETAAVDDPKATEQAQEVVPPPDPVPEQATEVNNDRDLNHNNKACNAVVEDIKVDTKDITITLGGVVDGNDNTIAGTTSPNKPLPHQQSAAIEESISSIGPTMWLGAQNGMLYVHSSVARWNLCLHKVKLPDSVLSIVHVESRVIVALANGTVAVFRRQVNGEWDLNSYHLLTLGSPKYSVRCLTIVGDKVWAAHRNKIHVIDPITLCILKSFEAHPRKESQIRQMATTGLGVWVSIRLDSTLRLFSAETYDHLEDIDIDPYVSKMLGTGKLGFSFVRITALLVSCNRLWIGTGNGVVISVPLTDASGASNTPYSPRFANAQLSFHGHRDAVKFFVSVPMNPPNHGLPTTSKDMLVISGGEGYIDFRLEEIVEDVCDTATHLLVWRVSSSYDDLCL
ncbi:JNK-interacting protein 3 isoform X2 [Anopheles coustani]|uniref:JNK-interacting protein 3 isoform X2 n=1 Tax=Anopheles coustani TaxID=139045 RepID=UPI002659EBC3|nr:JNK-interacting protein 3 isoform X2 [Anopheles coustani]